MFDMLVKYQASMFLDTSEIRPTPEVISSLLKMFKDRALLPATFHEIGIQNINPQPRIKLNSSDNEWVIYFANNRIDIEKNPVIKDGKNLGSPEKFSEDVIDLLERILKHFKKKGNRLSIVTTGLLEEMKPDQLDAVYRKLHLPLEFYNTSPPFEWSLRNVAHSSTKIKRKDEKLNVVTTISRIKGVFFGPDSQTPFERVEVAFDINTIAENSENRFTKDALKEFFEGALKLRAEIANEIRKKINE